MTTVHHPASVTVDVNASSDTNYVPQPTSVTRGTVTYGKGECIGASATTLAFLAFLAIQVSSICFFVSGAVFLSEEFTDIPDCAKSYKGWGIAMTILFGISAFNKNNSSSSGSGSGSAGFGTMACALGIVAIFPGLIAGLGYRDVLTQPDSCDVSDIAKLESWTTWIVVFNAVLTGLILVGMLISLVAAIAGCD